MNKFLRGIALAVVEAFDLPSPIMEIGSYQVVGQEELINLRSLFPNADYLGADIREGPGVDLVADVEDLPQPDGSVGTIIALNTFEHVKRFWRGFDEVHRVLRPDGAVRFHAVQCADSQLSERLLAVHARSVPTLTRRLSNADHRLARPRGEAGKCLGNRLPRGGSGGDAGAVCSLPEPDREARPPALALATAATLSPLRLDRSPPLLAPLLEQEDWHCELIANGQLVSV